jgi:arsenite methyltransferase
VSSTTDRWAAWLRDRRHGGDEERLRRTLELLAPIRERVLDGAAIGPGDVLLDIGCGDGLIGLGALDRGADVIFSDVSDALLDDCRAVAGDGARYLLADATDLSELADGSVDAVTTRSVLIYVAEKGRAFAEFHRILRPGGRLSIFEPVNRFGYPDPDGRFCGYDVTPVRDLAERVTAAMSPDGESTMLDFDERDLLRLAEAAGFDEIRLDYEARIDPGSWLEGTWEAVLNSSGNPLAPTLREAIEQALTPEEGERFVAHLRPLVEAGDARRRHAVAYLVAGKPDGG